MRNKFLSIFLATLMIFGGSFASFAATPITLEFYGPIQYKGPQDTSVVMPIINAWLIEKTTLEPFDWMSEKIDNRGTISDYIYFTPSGGKTDTYTLYYSKALPDGMLLEYFIIKTGTAFYVMKLPEPLAVGESIYIKLPVKDISHYYVGAYEPTELYSIITGFKRDADSEIELPIYGESFEFEIRDSEGNLVARAFSDPGEPGEGTLIFTMVDENEDPIDGMINLDNLELPEGVYTISELAKTGYEFVKYVIQDSQGGLDEGYTPYFEFTSGDDVDFTFYFYNRMKDSTINAFKFNADAEGKVPIVGVSFDFEVWEDKVGGEKVAIGRSDGDGKVLFFTAFDQNNDSIFPDDYVEDLVLLYGDYIIKEVNLPAAYEFIRYDMYADNVIMDPVEGFDGPEFPFSAGDVDTFRFEFFNRMKDSIITGIKLDENGEPFDGIFFDFVIRNNLDEPVATAKSNGPNGELMFLPVPIGEATPVSTLVLPYGIYTITEIDFTGYDFVKAQLIVDGGTPIDFNTPTVQFSAGDAESIHFIFNNVKEVEYKDETAYAIYNVVDGVDGGGALNSIPGNSEKWGWYINAPTLEEGTVSYNIYAGAAQNDITKGTLVGQVDVGIENGYFVTTFHLIGIYILGDVHFGSYVELTDIPQGVGNYTQTVEAAYAKYIVIHMVVWIPQ
jgi:hypothetical protein